MAERTNSSILWHHFHKDDVTGKAVCNICEDSISYKSTTANLKSHLKRKHLSTYSSLFPSDESVNKLLEKSSKRRMKRKPLPICSSTFSPEEPAGKIRKNSSSLWHYFYKNDETRKAECNICEESISFKSTTANLKSHLRRKHFSTYTSMISSEEPSEIRKHDHHTQQRDFDDNREIEEDDDNNISKDDYGNRASSSATTQVQNIKQRHGENMDYYVSKKKGLQQKKQIDADLLDLFIDGFHSFSLVDERAFKKFVRWIPGYKLPTREAISNSMLDELYLKTLENVREQVNAEIEQISITCDLWTSRAYESFIAVTGHYINRDFESKTVLLGCQQFDGEHNTGWNIASELRSILDQWNLRDKVNLVVSENAINIGIAIQELLGYQHFVCYAHTLDLIVSDALALFKESLDKAKMIVQHFRKSTVSAEKLTKFQIDLDKVPKQLVQQKDPSWNSTFLMLSSLVELEAAVRSTLGLVDVNLPILSEEEWIAFSSLCQILKPFESVTTLMSGEKYLTGSLVIVTTRCLKESCNKMLAKNNLPFIIKDIVTALKFGLENRFKNVEQTSTFAICTFLDPRFKMQAFSDQREGEKTKAIITELVVRTIEKSYRNEEMAEGDNNTYEEEDNLWTILDNFVEKNIARVTPLSKAIKEVDMYLADEVLARKNKSGEWNCPLQWWKNHRLVYPNLAELYIQKCNIVATSVPCQRMFSKTGNIIADRRTRLTTKKVEKLMFLNVNLGDARFKNYM